MQRIGILELAPFLILSGCAATTMQNVPGDGSWEMPACTVPESEISQARALADQRIRARGINPAALFAQAPEGSCDRIKYFRNLAEAYR